MHDRTRYRLSAAALVGCSILQILGYVLHPNDSMPTAYLQSGRWPLAHLCLAGSYLLAVFGLTGWYLSRRERVGRLGFATYLATVTASVLLVAVTLAEAYLLPVVARDQPPKPLAEWLDPTGPLAGAVVVSIVALIFYSAGFALLAAVIVVSREPARATGFLLIVGTILSDAEFFGPIGFTLSVVGGVLFGVALGWLGVAWWRSLGLHLSAHEA